MVIDAQPATPSAPVAGTITQPTCAVATGSFTIASFESTSTYTFTPTGPTVDGSGVVTLAAGATYTFTETRPGNVTNVTGITLEGPSANQTGTNLLDGGDHGWLSINEPLGAGQRIVLSGAFLADVADAMNDNTLVLSLIHI